MCVWGKFFPFIIATIQSLEILLQKSQDAKAIKWGVFVGAGGGDDEVFSRNR